MTDSEMTDEEIIKDRENKYGPPKRCFETWATMCETLNQYANESGNVNPAHLYALKMNLLKFVICTYIILKFLVIYPCLTILA